MSRQKRRTIWQYLFKINIFMLVVLLFFLGLQGWRNVLFWSLAGISWFALWFTDHLARQKNLRRIMAIRDIRTIDPFEFELRVGEVMREHGYKIERRGGQSDNGLDLILHKDGFSTAVQVKRYAGHSQIGEPMVREFFGSFAGTHDRGLYVTTSSYTRQAKEWARSRPIKLVDWQGWVALEEKVGFFH